MPESQMDWDNKEVWFGWDSNSTLWKDYNGFFL